MVFYFVPLEYIGIHTYITAPVACEFRNDWTPASASLTESCPLSIQLFGISLTALQSPEAFQRTQPSFPDSHADSGSVDLFLDASRPKSRRGSGLLDGMRRKSTGKVETVAKSGVSISYLMINN